MHNSYLYFPPQVIIIDDNINLATSLRLLLQQQNCKVTTFYTLQQATSYLQQYQLLQKLTPQQLITNPYPTVAIIDYMLPDGNGINFCSNWQLLNLKKILLTNKGTFKLATYTLNKKIIDYFIDKAHPKLSNEIVNTVRTLHQQVLDWLTPTVTKYKAHYLQDPNYYQLLQNIKKQYQIVSYCLANQDGNMLLRDLQDKIYYLSFFDEEKINSLAEIARFNNLPAQIIALMSQKSKAPIFIDKNNYPATEKWPQLLHSIVPVKLYNNVKLYYNICKLESLL